MKNLRTVVILITMIVWWGCSKADDDDVTGGAPPFLFLKIGNEWKFDYYDDRPGWGGEIVGFEIWRINYVGLDVSKNNMLMLDRGYVEEYEPKLPMLWWWTKDSFSDEYGAEGNTEGKGHFSLFFLDPKENYKGRKWSRTTTDSGLTNRYDCEITDVSVIKTVSGKEISCVEVRRKHYYDNDMMNPREIYLFWITLEYGIVGWQHTDPNNVHSDQNYTAKLRSVNF